MNVGSQEEPAPNCATKFEIEAEVIVPPSGHTSTMLSAGPMGVLPLMTGGVVAGGVVAGGVVAAEDNEGTVMGAGLLLQVTVYGLLCCCALSCLTMPGEGSNELSGGVV